MTRRTTNAFIYVNRVIEIGEVRQVVNANPLQWFPGLETGGHLFELRPVSPNLLMTIHADRGRRNASGCGRLDRSMTIATVDAVIADVVFVTELDWLLALDPLTGV